jgi:glycosyltransferase involved in cell wall biosynthesis
MADVFPSRAVTSATTPALLRRAGLGAHPRSPVRAAIIADMLEEGWTSMDIVADALMRELPSQDAWPVAPQLVRAAFVPVLGRLRRRDPSTADRVFNRFWLYRRVLGAARRRCDVFHIVDHSYAHLATSLPPGRTIVTCHDIDTFRGFRTSDAIDTGLPRFLVSRLAAGLRSAALVACPSRATANELAAAELVDPERIVVVPNGVDRPIDDEDSDREAAALLRCSEPTMDVLHVGSAIPRKRIDLLFEVAARTESRVRLVRVGMPLTPAQAQHAARLGIADRLLQLPFLSRSTLFGVYRRVSLLLMTSDREGFGLPVIEALSMGVPVIARDLPVLREVGGEAPLYLPPDPDVWASAVVRLLSERETPPWKARREAGRVWAAQFSWDRYATEMASLYAAVAGRSAPRAAAPAAPAASA